MIEGDEDEGVVVVDVGVAEALISHHRVHRAAKCQSAKVGGRTLSVLEGEAKVAKPLGPVKDQLRE